jgi:hypothetical protein
MPRRQTRQAGQRRRDQLIELGTAVIVKAHDLAIKHRVICSQEHLNAGAKLSETTEPVAVPGNQADACQVPIGKGAEAVVLDLVKPVRVRERLGATG